MLAGGPGGPPARLDELQGILVACCTAADPVAELQAARRNHPELADLLGRVDPDGLRLTALLVTKLRFERLLRGDPELARGFAADPAGFTARFSGYLRQVPPEAVFPEEEARRFRRFLAGSP